MLHSIDDLSRFTAEAKDASFPVKDVFFSLEDRNLTFVLIDAGSWFESDTVLVSAALVSDILTDERSCKLELDEDTLRRAPRWTSHEDAGLLEVLPPVIVGPFGNAISPLMMAALMNQKQEDTAIGDALTRSVDPFSTLRGIDVFGRDGEMGHLVDVLFADDTRQITHLVVDNGKVLSGRQLVVPIEKLSHLAKQKTHLVLTISSDELESAPQMEVKKRLDRNWLDSLRSYYQLPI